MPNMCVYKAYGCVFYFIYIENILEAHTPNCWLWLSLMEERGKDEGKYK